MHSMIVDQTPEITGISAKAEKRARPTLLVVDDDDGPRVSLRVLFAPEYRVLTAENGPQALQLVQSEPVTVAILDLRLGGMSGIEVFERMRELSPAVEIIILTAHESLETARLALRLGAFDYLSKPFEIPVIRTAVADAIERHERNRRLRALEEEVQQHKLQQEMARTKNEIYASILHDINGPLTFIRGISELLHRQAGKREDWPGLDRSEVKEQLHDLARQAAHCAELSQRYLSYLRQKPTSSVPVKLNQILTDLHRFLKFYPAGPGIEITIHPAPDNVMVFANAIDLLQALLNLTVNAIQSSSSPHQVELITDMHFESLDLARFGDAPNHLFINREQFQNVPPLVAVVVHDTGPGIPSELLLKVFRPYFTTKPPGKGTGLGLSIVRRCVRENGGGIHLHSVRGLGTTFTVYLRAALQE